jgi:two-component system response regulator VicR
MNRVLIVDDDPSIRRLLATLAKREGIHVDTATDGDEAISHLEEHTYSLVLLDLMMPRVNGFAVVDWLAQNALEHKPVVFVISAYADQMYRSVDTSVVSGVLHKPFDVGEVGSLLRHVVRGWDDDLAAALRNSHERAIREFIAAAERERTGPRRQH